MMTRHLSLLLAPLLIGAVVPLGRASASPVGSDSIRYLSSAPAPTARTLVSSPKEILGFAQDDKALAWVVWGGRDCNQLKMKSVASRPVVTIRGAGCPRRLINFWELGELVVAGTRVLGSEYVHRESTVWAEKDAFTASLQDRRASLLPCCEWRHDDSATRPDGLPAAGSGDMLVYYSHRDRLFDDEGDELTERAIRRVTDGRTVKLFDFDRPLALAVDRGRIALVWHGRGEVRLPDASIVASFNFLGSPKAVALDGATAAVLIERGSRSKVIALFDASYGKAQGEVRVAPGVTFLSAGGGWVVYGEGRSIRGFKARVRAVRLHFRARRIPNAVSAAGRRVAWFENHRGRGQILAFTLPH